MENDKQKHAPHKSIEFEQIYSQNARKSDQ